MGMDHLLSGMEISASGLSGERTRMDVAAMNIANIHTTRDVDGGPYQRRQVAFQAMMDQMLRPGTESADSFHGVRVSGITSDDTPGARVHNPGHPDADADGFVLMPNVDVSREMIDLVTASRAYEANLKSLETFRQLAEQALSLLQRLG